jgi:hypothetical protein
MGLARVPDEIIGRADVLATLERSLAGKSVVG